MEKKRNFGDEVLYITVERDQFRFDNNLRALFFKGKIKGILEMDNGQIYYFIEGDRFDIYRNEKVSNYPNGLQKIPSQYCFDNSKDLLKKVKQIF